MASEKLKLFSKLEIEVLSTGIVPCVVLTDVPNGLAQRSTMTIKASPAVNGVQGRGPQTARLLYNTQGRLVQLLVTPPNGVQITIYRARIWGRELPRGDWEWYPLPVIETPVEFEPAKLPIPLTPEDWTRAELPIPPTPEEWNRAELPIPPTPEEWHAAPLPIKPTADVPDWVDLEIDR